MEPASITTSLAVNLVASAVWEGAATGKQWYEERERRRAISEQLDAVSTEFNRELKAGIEDRIDGSEHTGEQ